MKREPKKAPPRPVKVTALAVRPAELARREDVTPPAFTRAGKIIFEDWFAGKSVDTRRSYLASARYFARWLVAKGWAKPGGHDVDVIVRALQAPEDEGTAMVIGWKAAQRAAGIADPSIATRMSGVKMLCRKLKAAKVIAYVPDFERPTVRSRGAYEANERYANVPQAFDALVAKLRPLAEAKGADAYLLRDWAIIRTDYLLGIRRIATVRLDVEHLSLKTGFGTIHDKGHDPETIRLPPGLIPALERWLVARAQLVKGGGPLFISIGRRPGGRLNRATINRIFAKRAKECGVDPADLTPHDARRVLATKSIETVGMKDAREITRHASMATLARYDLSAGRKTAEMHDEVARRIDRDGAGEAKKRTKKRVAARRGKRKR